MSKQNLYVRHYLQSTDLCGPASLKILLSHFGKDFSEEQLAQLAHATIGSEPGTGTEHIGMVKAIKKIGGYVFEKEYGTIDELQYFVEKEELPVIIGWFDKNDDHYSVVVSVTDKNIVIVDPAANEPERWLDRMTFPKIWFDFVGKENKIVSWGWYMVVSFEKLSADRFKVPDGNYH
ncbi:MAG TPA: cysteine peptidase family C39 domain-containing protein [Candidatus Paceibacterota bacterium]